MPHTSGGSITVGTWSTGHADTEHLRSGTRLGSAPTRSPLVDARRAVRGLLPEGRALPEHAWRHRHRLMLCLLWLHLPALLLFAVAMGEEVSHAATEGGLVAVLAALAGWGQLGRRARAVLTAVGLFSCSAILVHLSGGYIEAHFHFFVIVSLVALYQNWLTFLVGVGYVVLHHGLVGALAPESVYNHPAALAHPWRWAAIHAAFVLAACGTSLTSWRLKEEERKRAETDALTGLRNRGATLLTLEEVLDAGDGPTSLLLLDVDGLKTINDAAGHLVGDTVLRATAAVLGEALRQEDIAGRYGGDEFLVILPGAGAEDAERTADRLLARAAALTAEGEIPLRFSLGMASAPRDGTTASELVMVADAAMYRAKRHRGGEGVGDGHWGGDDAYSEAASIVLAACVRTRSGVH